MFNRVSNLFLALIFALSILPIHAKTDVLIVKQSFIGATVQRSKKVKYGFTFEETRRSRKVKTIRKRSVTIWPARLSNRQVQSVIRQALVLTKKPLSWQEPLAWLAFRESTDRPFAIAWEGVGGEYALGLMQMLPSTFREHAVPKYTNVWNPIDNMVAAIRYISGRYKSPWQIPNILSKSYQGY